jgi:2-keto-4-pentenoate hydratase/2-oxohepta-3-ene-1,7-dioic acid hydratase in catechol pathway
VRQLDYEGELAVVMASDGVVAGYAVADDLTARDLQAAESHWTRAKGFDASCPLGPWITTADEIPEPADLGIRTWVNGDLRQDGRTADMIFGIDDVLSYLAETCTIRAGDVLLTGTPPGVGAGMTPPLYLASGDVVRIEIDRLGTIEHRIA